jgi:hypothetical protein
MHVYIEYSTNIRITIIDAIITLRITPPTPMCSFIVLSQFNLWDSKLGKLVRGLT